MSVQESKLRIDLMHRMKPYATAKKSHSSNLSDYGTDMLGVFGDKLNGGWMPLCLLPVSKISMSHVGVAQGCSMFVVRLDGVFLIQQLQVF